MRTKAAARVVGIAIAATWSFDASAQLQPPTPLLPPPPGWNAQPAYVPVQQPSATQQQLNASDNASSFRRLELVYVNAEVGGAYANIGSNFYFPPAKVYASQGGIALGLGAGLRFLTFTLGVRGRVAPLAAYTLIEANGEAGFHLPLGAWDPYINIHGGYAQAAMNSQPLATLTSGGTPSSPPAIRRRPRPEGTSGAPSGRTTISPRSSRSGSTPLSTRSSSARIRRRSGPLPSEGAPAPVSPSSPPPTPGSTSISDRNVPPHRRVAMLDAPCRPRWRSAGFLPLSCRRF